MSMDEPDITDPVDVARLAFGAEDGVVQGDVTWQSYVDTYDDGTITAESISTTTPCSKATMRAGSAIGSSTSDPLLTAPFDKR